MKGVDGTTEEAPKGVWKQRREEILSTQNPIWRATKNIHLFLRQTPLPSLIYTDASVNALVDTFILLDTFTFTYNATYHSTCTLHLLPSSSCVLWLSFSLCNVYSCLSAFFASDLAEPASNTIPIAVYIALPASGILHPLAEHTLISLRSFFYPQCITLLACARYSFSFQRLPQYGFPRQPTHLPTDPAATFLILALGSWTFGLLALCQHYSTSIRYFLAAAAFTVVPVVFCSRLSVTSVSEIALVPFSPVCGFPRCDCYLLAQFCSTPRMLK